MSPVKAATAPEEDFFILEDEAPLLFRIPRTMSSSKRRSRTSGSVSDSQTSKTSPGEPSETVEREQEVTDAANPVVELKKNRKEKVKKIPEPPEKLRPPVDERLVHEKPIKKQSKAKQVYFEKSDVNPQDSAGEVGTDLEEPSRKMTKKSPKNEEVKKAKAAKQNKTKVKMERNGSQVVKEMLHLEDGIEGNQEPSNDDGGHADDPPAGPSGNIQIPKRRLMNILVDSNDKMPLVIFLYR